MKVIMWWLTAVLVADAHRLRQMQTLRAAVRLPRGVDPVPDAGAHPLTHIEDISDPVEDIELRQKPPHHMTGDDASNDNRLLAADLDELMKETRDDMRECMIVHEYAEPFEVKDAVQGGHQHVQLSNDSGYRYVPPLQRPGAIWDDTPRGTRSAPLAIEMYAYLTGNAGLVQVIPHGIMASWTSKEKVPMGGFLCNHRGQHLSAPVLHATSTPCIPTSMDSEGQPLAPDQFEVFVGTTRLQFDSESKARTFCEELSTKIASDLSVTKWDASALGEFYQEKNPNVQTFIAQTAKLTSPEGWTKGTKRVLVVVMDWKVGDQSLAPYSRQESNPIPHYQNHIFPAVDEHFRKMSYGQFGIDVTFVPKVIRYTRDRNRYTTGDLPFPGLYNAAKESMEGSISGYSFDSYELVYVIAPQVTPTGTKGVAYVGQKGAMCNGCETLSDNFKIMVAVHELGHNLGLFHASSTALEYGNVFDWMGNYPDVVGLHYGLGYKYLLGWISSDYIYEVGDGDLAGLSTEVIITPYDTSARMSGDQVAGIKVSLSRASRDLWVSYRSTPKAENKGVYIVLQEKDHANSELVDTACHTISQQDAHMQEGWTFLDRTHQVAIKVLATTPEAARVHIFSVSGSDVPRLYGMDTFTDGETKCPRTCRDANLLITEYNCPNLKSSGYCSNGALTMMGSKFTIGGEICPATCDQCGSLMKMGTLKSGGCKDTNVRISGKDCQGVARAQWCGYETSSGSSVGKDLCPASCGECPSAVTPSSQPFTFPAIKDTIGSTSFTDASKVAPLPTPPPAPAPPAPVDPTTEDGGDAGFTPADVGCHDEESWTDVDGDGCAEYATVIKSGKWTQKDACDYNKGAARAMCRKTCDECEVSPNTCVDSACVETFMAISGRCEQCVDHIKYCKMSFMKEECPLTCGQCQPSRAADMAVPPSSVTRVTQKEEYATIVDDEACRDDPCVEAWAVDGKCVKCEELGQGFCDEAIFARACKRSCKMCTDGGVPEVCADIFSTFTCSRYKKYGWCQRDDMRDAVQRQCPLTCGICTNEPSDNKPSAKPSADHSDGAGDDDDDDDESDDSGGSGDAADDTDDDDDSDESGGTDSKEDQPQAGSPCRCMRSWSSPGDAGCEKEQRYCPETACDGDTKNWCLIATPGCATEAKEDGEGQGWSYCNPEDYKSAAREERPKPSDAWKKPLGAPGEKHSGAPRPSARLLPVAVAFLAGAGTA